MTARFSRVAVAALVLVTGVTGLPGGPVSAAPLATSASGSSRYATLGLAVAGGNPANYQAALRNGLPIKWARIFANPRTVPPTFSAWPEAVAAHNMGLKLWISVFLDPARLAAGALDAQVARLAASMPAGTRLTLLHEPSYKGHHLSPAGYQAAFDHGSAVVQRASHGAVLTGPIDVRANILTEHYLNGLDRRYVQFVGIDGYDGIQGSKPGGSYASLAGPVFAYVHRLFPGVPTGFAEFNSSRTTGRAQWIADALAWGQSVGATPMMLFTAFAPYRLSTAEQRQLASIIDH